MQVSQALTLSTVPNAHPFQKLLTGPSMHELQNNLHFPQTFWTTLIHRTTLLELLNLPLFRVMESILYCLRVTTFWVYFTVSLKIISAKIDLNCWLQKQLEDSQSNPPKKTVSITLSLWCRTLKFKLIMNNLWNYGNMGEMVS